MTVSADQRNRVLEPWGAHLCRSKEPGVASTVHTSAAQDSFAALGRPTSRAGKHSVSLRLLCVRMDDCRLLEPVHCENEVSLVAPPSPTGSLHSGQVSDDELPKLPVIHVEVTLSMALSGAYISRREYKLAGESFETSLGAILGWARGEVSTADGIGMEVVVGPTRRKAFAQLLRTGITNGDGHSKPEAECRVATGLSKKEI